MFSQPKVKGQKLKATSGRGNGTNYTTPGGMRAKVSDKTMARIADCDDSAHEPLRSPYPGDRVMRPQGKQTDSQVYWAGKPANRDTRPENPNIRTTGPAPLAGGKSFKRG